MVGTLSATADGKIGIRATQVKAAQVPVKGLLKLFGPDLAKPIQHEKHQRPRRGR